MTVLNFWSSEHPDTSIDLFIEEPFDFDAENYSGLRNCENRSNGELSNID